MSKVQYTSSKYQANFIALILLAIMSFSSIAVISWGLDRCLGFRDEGVYVLSARYPMEFQQTVSATYIYTGFLFRIVNYDLVLFRLLGVIIIMASAFWFWFGFYKLLVKLCPETRTIKYIPILSLVFIELGALLLYQWFYLTPNYNTLNSVAISLFSGSFLWGFSLLENWQENRKLIIFSFLLSGLSLGFAVFIKIPSGICLIALSFFVIFLWRFINKKQRLIILTSILAGIIIWVSCYFLFVQPPKIWWQMFNEGWMLYQAYGLHTSKKSFVYLKETFSFFYIAIKIYWPCYLLLSASLTFFILKGKFVMFSEKLLSYIIYGVIIIAVLLSLKSGVFISERNTGGIIPFYLVFYMAWILLLLNIWIFSSWFQARYFKINFFKGINTNIPILFILLFTLPMAGAFGTGAPIYNTTLCHAATWFGAILLLLVLCSAKNKRILRLMPYSIIIISLFSTSHIIQGFIFQPQLISGNLFQQTERTKVGFPENTLKLDIQTHKLVKELSIMAKTNGFEPGDDVIAISHIAGIVYAIGGRSPGHPVFLTGIERFFNYSTQALRFADLKRLRNAFILLNVAPKEAQDLLITRGLNFPVGYNKLGTVVSDTTKYSLWKPITLNTLE